MKIPMGQIVIKLIHNKKDMTNHDVFNELFSMMNEKKQYICRKVNASSSLDFFKLHQHA